MMRSNVLLSAVINALQIATASAWATNGGLRSSHSSSTVLAAGNLHAQSACFMPLKQCPEGYYAPRILQIAGAYPGLGREEYMAVQSEEAPIPGQWGYDFSDPDGPQMGTVAIEGSKEVASCIDPVAIIAEHKSLNIELPSAVVGDVDVLVLVDRAHKTYAERRFLVTDVGNNKLQIAAYEAKQDVEGEILGQVVLVQIPWLSAMGSKKTGFLEEDEYF